MKRPVYLTGYYFIKYFQTASFVKYQRRHIFPKYLQSYVPQWARAFLLQWVHNHTQTQHTRQHSFGRLIGPKQKPLPDNAQQPQETDIHAAGEIRTRSPSKREAADSLLRPRGQCDWFIQTRVGADVLVSCHVYSPIAANTLLQRAMFSFR